MANLSVAAIVDAVRSVTGPGPVPLQRPDMGIAEIESLVAYADADPIGYEAVNAFQAALGAIMGRKHCVAVSSGTAALHLALMAAGVEDGDEVLMPALTFIGTANAASYIGATPHFVDVSFENFGIWPEKLNTYLEKIAAPASPFPLNKSNGCRISAIVAVHLLGHPCDIAGLRKVAHRWGIPLIEDAAQALGSKVQVGAAIGPVGREGIAACISFNNNKIVTTNGGGAVLTDDDEFADRVWRLATTARVPHPFLMEHSAIAWNYRMGNVNAALGLPQLLRLDKLVEAKRRLAELYGARLPGIAMMEPENTRANYWLNALLIDGRMVERDEILTALTSDGIAARALFTPLHLSRPYEHHPRDDLTNTLMIWCNTVCLPSSASLGFEK